MKLSINEIFGPTIQGEGPRVGRRSFFVRVAGCPLYCFWCDTAYTWRFNEVRPHRSGKVFSKEAEVMSLGIESVVDKLDIAGYRPTDHLVLTGGEPMAQYKGLTYLIDMLQTRFQTHSLDIGIETAGNIFNREFCIREGVNFVVSPKLTNSGMPRKVRINDNALANYVLMTDCAFKFVVSNLSTSQDFDEIDELCAEFSIPFDRVWIMPEGTSALKFVGSIDDTIFNNSLLDIVHRTISRGFNLTTRMHILLWGNRRGV